MNRKSARQGFTLLELLVAVALLGLFFPMVCDLCMQNVAEMTALRDEIEVTREAQFAADTLARDFGAAQSPSSSVHQLTLQVRENYTNMVPVRYYLDDTGTKLLRENTLSGERTLLAADVAEFRAVVAAEDNVIIQLALHKHSASNSLSLSCQVLP